MKKKHGEKREMAFFFFLIVDSCSVWTHFQATARDVLTKYMRQRKREERERENERLGWMDLKAWVLPMDGWWKGCSHLQVTWLRWTVLHTKWKLHAVSLIKCSGFLWLFQIDHCLITREVILRGEEGGETQKEGRVDGKVEN